MAFDLDVRREITKEVRRVSMNLDWNEGQRWYFTEGNFGCDCNRHDLFHGTTLEGECGSGKFTIMRAILPGGELIELESEEEEEEEEQG